MTGIAGESAGTTDGTAGTGGTCAGIVGCAAETGAGFIDGAETDGAETAGAAIAVGANAIAAAEPNNRNALNDIMKIPQ